VGGAETAKATTYNEVAQGDLSGQSNEPTNIGALETGSNYVIGDSIPSGSLIPDGHGALTNQDNDFFTFTVPKGDVLSAFDLVNDSTITSGDRFFLGIYDGATSPVDPSNPTPAGLLGYTLPGTTQIGKNLLPDLAASDEAGFPALTNHFSGDLGAGQYTVWLVDGDAPVHYDLDLGISAAPEPEMWLLMILGVGLTGATLRRRSPRAVGAGVS
jgi:hypothetical protein